MFPEIPLYETTINPENNEWLCGEYKITDAMNIKFTPVIDHNINQCKGVFGFKQADFPKIIDHFKAVEDFYKKKLEECEAR